MSVTGMGTRQKGIRLPILGLTSGGLLLAALILGTIQLSHFAQGRDLLQTDLTVAGVPVSGLKLSEAVTVWEHYYQQPIVLDYQGKPIYLDPAQLGFHLNSDLMLAEVESKISTTSNYWVDFWNYLWQRPTTPVTVELNADYQRAKLTEYLQDVARRYDHGPSLAKVDLDNMVFDAGANGSVLDVDKSAQLIDDALRRPSNRTVKLVMKSENGQGADMSTLQQAILDYLNAKNFPPDGKTTLASVTVIDLESGQEMSINPNIAYSGMSTIKIPIMINIFGRLQTISDYIKWSMGASILCSSNDDSNRLVQAAGGGDMGTGLGQVTSIAETIGATNTFLTAPLFVGDSVKPFSIQNPKTTPDKNFNAKPDTWNQTTSSDMATLLEQIYDCSEYGSGLAAIFPDMYTQTKCKQMIELLSGNIIGRMIELGVPAGTRVAHKNGWGVVNNGQNASDVGIVYSPGRRYVLAAYLWQTDTTDGNVKMIPWESIEGISRLTYNFFNPDKPLSVARSPENKYTALNCVMPNPDLDKRQRLSLDNINNGRFDANGYILPDACINYPFCDGKATSAGSGTQANPPSSTQPAVQPTIDIAATQDSPPLKP